MGIAVVPQLSGVLLEHKKGFPKLKQTDTCANSSQQQNNHAYTAVKRDKMI